MIHKDFPGGLEDLQEYVMEVTQGIKDHWTRKSADNTQDTRWEYTYHQRVFAYSVPGIETVYDQIQLLASRLAETPHSRRAQAITWKVWEDNFCYDPACLQSIWCRMLQDISGDWYLNMNIRFRSNDAYKAAFMNMFAFIRLQQLIAEKIAGLTGKNIKLGRYIHQADSYHIYGSYLREFNDRFMQALRQRTFVQRTLQYESVKDMMTEAIPLIMDKVSKARP
jgi:thymidylate synthase